MVHLRIVAPERCSHDVLELLESSESVLNVVYLEGAARKPPGDVILCGALAQLLLNLAIIFVAGTVTLYLQRRVYISRRRKHLGDPARKAAGLPGQWTRRRRAPARSDRG